MSLKTDLNQLTEPDIYSLLMFALYKATDDPECAALSQLSYILDLKNLLKLCEFFGGLTLKIPTVDELEELVYALLLFQLHDIEHKDYEASLQKVCEADVNKSKVERRYKLIRELLNNYDFNSGRAT